MQRNAKRILARTLLPGFAAGALVLGLGGPAAAHVTVSADGTTAGGYTLLTFSVPHGCEGEATTAVAIQIPEPLNSVTPTINPNWDVEMVSTELDEPIADSHGNELTERISEVVYTAHDPLPDNYRDAFELSLRLPEETAGETLVFPVIQICDDSEHPWIQVGEEGEDLDSPAPFIEVTAAGAEAAETETETEVETQTDEHATEAHESDSSGSLLTYVALALGALGAVLGAVGLLKGRRTS